MIWLAGFDCPDKLGVRCVPLLTSGLLDRISWGGSMRWRPTQFLVSVVLAVILANELNAQTTTSGGLTGVVTDQSGAVVPNVEVQIRDSAKGTTQSTKTDQ